MRAWLRVSFRTRTEAASRWRFAESLGAEIATTCAGRSVDHAIRVGGRRRKLPLDVTPRGRV
jgi:hypothetical protein